MTIYFPMHFPCSMVIAVFMQLRSELHGSHSNLKAILTKDNSENYFQSMSFFSKQMKDLCQGLHQYERPVEFNTSGIQPSPPRTQSRSICQRD